MIISKQELLDVFENAYEIGKQIETESKRISDMLAGYAEANSISKKAVKQAFTSYKAFKEGKVSIQDDDYFTILSILEEHFSGESDSTADQIAG